MTLHEFSSLSGGLGFRVVGDRILGVHNGYPFTLAIRNMKNKDSLTLTFSVGRAVNGKLLRMVKKALPKGSSATTAVAMQLTITSVTEDESDALTRCMTLLDIVTETFRSAAKPVTVREKCSVCNKSDCDSFAMVAAQFVPVHRACMLEQTGKEAMRVKKNKSSSGLNYLLGFVGALLGAFVGCIPSILLIFFAQYEFGILYLLIPVASYKGYQIFRGKNGGVARIIVIFSSLAAFGLMLPTVFHLYRLANDYVYSWFFNAVLYYTRPILDIAANAWFGALFLVVGIVSGFKTIGTTNDAALRDVAANLESLTNLDGSYSPAEMPRDASTDVNRYGVQLEY